LGSTSGLATAWHATRSRTTSTIRAAVDLMRMSCLIGIRRHDAHAAGPPGA
jgi:hypothetical protein